MLVADWNEGLRRRGARNNLLKDMLLQGKSIQYRSAGRSVYPRVQSNALCVYDPVTSAESVQQNDIVFCARRKEKVHT